jgi:hypothetical protein
MGFRWGQAFALLLLAVLAGGCAPLPNVDPFVDASSQLRSAIITSGAAVEAELAQAWEDEAYAAKLSSLWKLRVQAADGLVRYAESLAEIVRSGRKGAETARMLADSAAALSKDVGVVLPPASTVSTVTDTAAFIYGHIAAARASRSLEQALVSVQPAVDQLTAVMARDLKDVDTLLRAAYQQEMNELTSRYNVEAGYLHDLNKEQNAIYQKAPRTREDEKRLLEIDQLVEATKAWRLPMEAEKQQAARRLNAGRLLIAGARQGLASWALAHQQLIVAVREKTTVDVIALVEATQEMRELVRRIREI